MKKKIILISCAVVCVVVAVLSFTVIVPKAKYNHAMKLIQSGEYNEAVTVLEKLDAQKYQNDIVECKYKIACNLFTSKKYTEAEKTFEGLGNYKDSEDYIMKCKYNAATDLYNSKKYEEAEKAFVELDGYEDSMNYIKMCRYNRALDLYNKKNYEEAAKLFKKADDYEQSEELYAKCMYIQGKALYDEKKYTDALAYLVDADNINDSSKMIYQIEKNQIKSAKVKSSVYFGKVHYETNNGGQNEPIKWTVLEIKDNMALLLSDNVLTNEVYMDREVDTKIDWHMSSLNNRYAYTYFSTFFFEKEQNVIYNDTYYSSNGVFILSEDEIRDYFKDSKERIATNIYDKSSPAAYWLRSDVYEPHGAEMFKALVQGERHEKHMCADSIDENGYVYNEKLATDICGVRPAIWIDLSKL